MPRSQFWLGSLILVSMFATPAAARVEVGDAPPPLEVEAVLNAPADIDLSWDAMAGRTVVVEFWGTWCGPCVAVIPHMNELADALEDEGVAFVSITYEEPELIERFLKAKPMRPWVGCDTDRSVVDAYEPRGWPTAFVVHDGVVAWIGHPAGLTAEKVRAVAGGEVFAEPKREEADPVEPVRRRSHLIGSDPYSTITAVPMFQVLVRESLESAWSNSTSRSTDREADVDLGIPLKELVRNAWGFPGYAVTGDDWAETTRFDVIVAMPRAMDSEAIEALIREAIKHGAGAELSFGTRPATGYRLRVADGGPRLQASGEFSAGGGSYGGGDGAWMIKGERFAIGAVQHLVSIAMAGPTVDETGLGGAYDISFSVPSEATVEAFTAALEEQLGLTLVPFETEVETVHVTRAEGGEE